MKDLIIIVGTILLACILFSMIAGDKDSLKSASGKWFEKSIERMYQER
ncbi:hypothetical protein ACPW7J_06060 [Ihubacter sp. rT4E-8]